MLLRLLAVAAAELGEEALGGDAVANGDSAHGAGASVVEVTTEYCIKLS